MPHFPMNTGTVVASSNAKDEQEERQTAPVRPPASIQIKNRRKRYLETHPDYFSAGLELADPLLYDRLIRRFQTTGEREEEGRAKGYSGALEADLMRAELKMEALAHPDPNATITYTRGPQGEILAEEDDEIPATREEGEERWKTEMELRFLRGADPDFDYAAVDECEDYDDLSEEQDKYFDDEEPEWLVEKGEDGQVELRGETGVQDF
ncbi:hypothetical protein LOZ12_001239 [Ophidiomyces ophidiicola]|uniref:Uncharacterized protein n=1 Tax=Ophidiomyces ophidiicola TaxID=1387563 RepID=A0ACB8V5J8_9EURO|nr:uncharacterized protein LOZ57_004160 [Ophidiomyces ophidiicola]KAI1921309.1 hypothetical protein LOZ64_001591 [Ophidiomyces ophidiicola]KAI1945474.1 hypothetical protein LOZ57_004160 [Ophidiomyces ophidiicola]KAI1950252.1 hypothetical protein LOZ62_001999 [Ophidiomyces ophidiicola]KAI1972930.1 hypothetical protein LOZ56_002124 [Ophidiomyces ophidiicola]KAI2008531.1 hypothetical protein LOZ50_001997 [Ophidiomyces ophidiicola]